MSQQLWEPGNYKGNLVEAVFGKSSTGTPQVVLIFDIDGNRKIVFAYLSDAAKERTFDDMEKMGWNGSASAPEFTNREGIELYMKHDTYEGKTNEKWSISSGGFKPEPMGSDQLKLIEAQWRSRGGKSAPSRPAPAKPSAAPARPTAAPARPTKVAAFGKDEAWAHFEKSGKTNADFYEIIESIEKEKGSTEAQFGEAEWKLVVAAADIPF